LAAPIAGNPMADALEAGELLDVEVDEFASAGAVVAPRRLTRLQLRQPAQAETSEMPSDGAAWQLQAPGNLLAVIR
jgi:hypothetical protein